jgi:hypothetical protein
MVTTGLLLLLKSTDVLSRIFCHHLQPSTAIFEVAKLVLKPNAVQLTVVPECLNKTFVQLDRYHELQGEARADNRKRMRPTPTVQLQQSETTTRRYCGLQHLQRTRVNSTQYPCQRSTHNGWIGMAKS